MSSARRDRTLRPARRPGEAPLPRFLFLAPPFLRPRACAPSSCSLLLLPAHAHFFFRLRLAYYARARRGHLFLQPLLLFFLRTLLPARSATARRTASAASSRQASHRSPDAWTLARTPGACCDARGFSGRRSTSARHDAIAAPAPMTGSTMTTRSAVQDAGASPAAVLSPARRGVTVAPTRCRGPLAPRRGSSFCPRRSNCVAAAHGADVIALHVDRDFRSAAWEAEPPCQNQCAARQLVPAARRVPARCRRTTLAHALHQRLFDRFGGSAQRSPPAARRPPPSSMI